MKLFESLVELIRPKDKSIDKSLESTPEKLESIERKILKAEKRLAIAITTATVVVLL